MHAVGVREDVVEVGEDVVGRERDKLASTPEHLAEEVVSVVGVGEGDVEADDEAVGVAIVLLVEVEHGRSARREVAVAGLEEEASELSRAPPPRDGPHPQAILDDDSGRVLPLRHGGRATVGRAVELHGGSSGGFGSKRRSGGGLRDECERDEEMVPFYSRVAAVVNVYTVPSRSFSLLRSYWHK